MADIVNAISTYSSGTIDTASTLVDNVSPHAAKHVNYPVGAIIQVETTLGSGTTLKGSTADLATRLAVSLAPDGHISSAGVADIMATTSSRTNTSETILTLASTTSGSPAAGIGTDILIQAESADESPCNMVQIGGALSDVSAGSEDSYFRILLRVAGAALTDAYRFAVTTAFNAIFTHANTADRTYTFPNETTTVAGTDATQTFTNKTFGAAPGTPIANVAYSESLVRGFVVFQIDGTIDTDLNVSSITDHGAGDWTVNWARAFSSANYGINLSAQSDSFDAAILCINHTQNPTASSVRILYGSIATGAGIDPTGNRIRIYASAFGVQ